MADLTELIGDQLFHSQPSIALGIGRANCHALAADALQAARAQGWRIVKLARHGRELTAEPGEIVVVTGEWTG